MAYYHCPYCGKERPHSYYGGVGPCDCSGYLAEQARIQEKIEVEKRALIEREKQQRRSEAACPGHQFERVGMHVAKCKICGKMIGG